MPASAAGADGALMPEDPGGALRWGATVRGLASAVVRELEARRLVDPAAAAAARGAVFEVLADELFRDGRAVELEPPAGG